MITLRQFTDNDLAVFKEWLKTPHVANWYHEPNDWIYEVETRNTEFNWLHHFIVEYENQPIGFCQYYECIHAEEDWYGNIEVPGTYSIDYLIGDVNFLKKGYGKAIVNALIEKIKSNVNAKRIIVQPELENKASCNTLLSCNFKFDNENQIYILNL